MAEKSKLDKRFQCILCEYATGHKSNLKRHVMIMHGNIKKYACKVCMKTDKSESEHITYLTCYLRNTYLYRFSRLYLFCLATIALWSHLTPFRTQK